MISYPFQAHLANTKRRAFNNIEQGLYLGACNACFKFTLQVCPYETDVMAEVCIRVCHLQFFWISLLFQAGTSVCHTQEQKNIGLLCFMSVSSSYFLLLCRTITI